MALLVGVPWHTVTDRADTVLIVASGPSLRGFDLAQLHGKGYIIAVNGAVDFVPFADAWITVDTLNLERRIPAWTWPRYIAAPEDFGQLDARCPCDRAVPKSMPTVTHYLYRTDTFSESPDAICGGNSALGALNLAYHLKAQQIVLFGVDGTNIGQYFYGKRRSFPKQDETMRRLPEMFAAAAPYFTECKVVNASPGSAVTCFPRISAAEALSLLYVPSAER